MWHPFQKTEGGPRVPGGSRSGLLLTTLPRGRNQPLSDLESPGLLDASQLITT